MLGFIPAMIMWGPATAVRNIMAGTSNLFQSVGLQSRMGKFNQALNNSNDPWHQIAMFVNEQASKTLVHTGLAKEFEMFTDMSSPHKDVMTASQNFFMKLADLFGAETFLNMDISSSYSKLFSLKGSEKHMREEVKGLIFNNILNDINRIGIKFDTTEGQKSYNSNIELISKMYQQHEQNAFFKITRALGDFSPLAKPYWTHGFQDNASKSGAALTGALLKWLYMFRHPMLVNTENTLLSITELLYDKSMSGTVDRNKIAKGGMISAALMFATYELFKDILWEQEAYVGSLETLNPLQDLNKPMRLAMASILAPIFGLKVTEENARKIEAENIRFLANMLGGNALASAYREDRTMKDFYQSWVNVFNLPSTLLDVIIHGSNEVVSNGKTNALYDKRHQFRKQWGELTSLDPIWLVERLIEYNTIKDPYDKASTVAFRKDTMLKNLATWVGISVYGNTPERVWNAYGSTYWSDQAYDDTKTYLSKRRLYPYNSRTANRFVNSIENYGKAPSPSSEIVRIR